MAVNLHKWPDRFIVRGRARARRSVISRMKHRVSNILRSEPRVNFTTGIITRVIYDASVAKGREKKKLKEKGRRQTGDVTKKYSDLVGIP